MAGVDDGGSGEGDLVSSGVWVWRTGVICRCGCGWCNIGGCDGICEGKGGTGGIGGTGGGGDADRSIV